MIENNFTRKQHDTKQRILNAAEYLFSHEGFHGTSLRAITGKAAVNLASVNYHFGSKELLLEEVLKRRLIGRSPAKGEETIRERLSSCFY
jgi:AcrR family transcriptional regulator